MEHKFSIATRDACRPNYPKDYEVAAFNKGYRHGYFAQRFMKTKYVNAYSRGYNEGAAQRYIDLGED